MAPAAATEHAPPPLFSAPGVRACLRGGLPERERRRSYSGHAPAMLERNAPQRRRRILWRRASSAHSAAAAARSASLGLGENTAHNAPHGDRSRSAPPQPAGGSSGRRSSFRSNSAALPPRPRSAALRRVREVLFERASEWRGGDARSTKRRIIQVSRQHERAAALCALGYRSRTGWEPVRAVRENQDCLVAVVPWGPHGQYSLFGALDGHGRAGHFASMFVAERVISYLVRSLKKPKVDVAFELHRAFDYAEQRLESDDTHIDCTVSGSTGVFVLLDRSMLYCANVGDSRAVLGRKLSKWSAQGKTGFVEGIQIEPNGALSPGSSYVAVPLSFDHKPNRLDEKTRIEKAGGRVDAWQSFDCDEERVWLPDSRTPGLGVTRSFGDLIVKGIGVNAAPEIYAMPLSHCDRFIVIGSDGVFEFVSNEEVVAIVSRHREKGSPQNAAEEIVKLSTDRWVEDESVVDDISCIVVFIDVKEASSNEPSTPKLVQVDVNNVGTAELNTPINSRANSLKPNAAASGQLFGQCASSSAAQSRTTSTNRRSGPHPRQNNGEDRPRSDEEALNDIVRKYALRVQEERAKRVSCEKERRNSTGRRNDAASDGGGSDIFAQSKLAAGSASSQAGADVASLVASPSERSVASPTGRPMSCTASDVDMPASAFEGDVSDESERFEDAEENVADMDVTAGAEERASALRIAPSMSTKGLDAAASATPDKMECPVDEDDEKYADADDTLVPIDAHRKVVHAYRPSASRRRLDRREPVGLGAAVEEPPSVGGGGGGGGGGGKEGIFRFARGMRARRAASRDVYDDAGSGRLRRLLPKRPRSSFSADGY